jgi:hypothetical protein
MLHNKLDISDEMIEAAVVEFLDHRRYFAALNLAGVAEELYGIYARINGKQNCQDGLIELAQTIAKIDGAEEFPRKGWRNIANYSKNAIKHLDDESDIEIELDSFDEARAMIGNALSNHALLSRKITPTIQRFYVFANAWAVDHVDHGRQPVDVLLR